MVRRDVLGVARAVAPLRVRRRHPRVAGRQVRRTAGLAALTAGTGRSAAATAAAATALAAREHVRATKRLCGRSGAKRERERERERKRE